MMQTYDVCHEEFSNTRYEGHTYERWLPTFLLSFGIYAGLFGIKISVRTTVALYSIGLPKFLYEKSAILEEGKGYPNFLYGKSAISAWKTRFSKFQHGKSATLWKKQVSEIPVREKCHLYSKNGVFEKNPVCRHLLLFCIQGEKIREKILHFLWPVMIHSRKWRAGAYFLRDPGSFSSPV